MKDEIKEILDRLERIDHKEYIAFEFADSATFDEMARCFEERKKMANYITNLQEELEYQKQAEQEYNEKHTKLMKKYKELQERKDKAIKYLEQPNRDNFDYSKAQLLDILNGGDDNE